MLTKELVKKEAKKMGFDLVGITSAKPMLELEKILERRQLTGKESPFVSSKIKKRVDPKTFFSEGKTILMVGLNYFQTFEDAVKKELKFARYTWGEDYHLVITEKLEQLGKELKEIEPKLKYKIFVDTGPLVERELGNRAGLGFLGKNASLINRQIGSWFFLGGMVLNWELEEDGPAEGECGDCQLCQKICPSGAIEAPYQINPLLCQSYLTQKKGYLTLEECKKMGDRIFGCDLCQKVCPFNREARMETMENRLKIKEHLSLTPEEILKLSQEEFKRYFDSTAIAWRGNNLLKRNVLIGLANSRGEGSLPILQKNLMSPSPLLRGQSAILLSGFQNKDVAKVLTKALAKERDLNAKREMEKALQRVSEPKKPNES